MTEVMQAGESGWGTAEAETFPGGGRAFTLIELLVVIAIIAILAALLMPSLQQARESAWKAVCIGNQRSVGALVLQYAHDHDEVTPHLWDRHARLTWHNRLIDSGYTQNPAPGQPNIFLCPSHRPRAWTSPAYVTQEKSYAYGMRLVAGNSDADATYGFKFGSGSVEPVLMKLDFGSPSQFLFIADSILNHWANPGDAGHLYQRYYFRAGNIAVYSDSVHLRHNGTGNFLFGDGHVESLRKDQLVGRYGAVNGTDAFVEDAVYESDGFF